MSDAWVVGGMSDSGVAGCVDRLTRSVAFVRSAASALYDRPCGGRTFRGPAMVQTGPSRAWGRPGRRRMPHHGTNPRFPDKGQNLRDLGTKP